MIEAILVAACLLGIIAFMVRDIFGFRATGSFASAPMEGSNGVRAFLVGLVGVAALIGMAEQEAFPASSLVTFAIGFGALAALMSMSAAINNVAEWGLSAIGLIAAVPAVVGLMTGQAACSAGSAVASIASGVLLVAVAALAVLVAVFTPAQIKPASGVALFGAVEVIAYLNTPLGVSLIDSAPLAYTLSIVGAALLGFAVVRAPTLVLGAAGLAILGAVLVPNGGCGGGVDYVASFGALAAYLVGYGLLLLVRRLFRR